MVNYKFKLKKKDYKTKQKSMTVPNQALTVKQIVDRWVKGLPVEVSQRQPQYMDQNDRDYSKLAGLDRAEQAYIATEMSEQAEQLGRQVEANQATLEAQEAEEREAKKARLRAKRHSSNLDNTMPNDTTTENQEVSGGRNKK